MNELISAAEAAKRAGVSKEWILKLCAQARIPGARKIGNQWIIPAGAKVLPPVAIGRPLRTLEIPRGEYPSAREAGGKRSGKKGGKR